MMAKSLQLKDEGNRRFQAGDFVMAEALYSQAYAPMVHGSMDSPNKR
jgi:hypothetical protein